MITLTIASLVLSLPVPNVALSAQTEPPNDVAISETGASPESITSTQDGTVYFGSTAKGTIYRALPKQTQAEPWIKASEVGLTNVLGVLADEKRKTLWVCSNVSSGRNAAAGGQTALRSFDLKTGSPKGTYPTPGGGLFNDIAVAKDGTVYVSDMSDSRILRLQPKATALDVWVSDPQLRGIDGLTFLADGALYFNNYFNGKFSRIQLQRDGTAGPIVDLETSVKFTRPDALRTSGAKTMLQIEGSGRLTEITIDGDKATAKVLGEGFTGASGLTQVGKEILVLVQRTKAVRVSYPK
jgi:streptogramin lyase